MKKGNIIVCVDLKGIDTNVPLTFNKHYIIDDISYDGYYVIINDDDKYAHYLPDRFISLSEYRETQLDNILDEKES